MGFRHLMALPLALLTALALCGCAQEEPSEVIDVLFGEDQLLVYMDAPKGLELAAGSDWASLDYDASDWYEGYGAFGAKMGAKEQLAEGYLPDVLLLQYDYNGRNLPVYYFRTSFVMPEGKRADDYAVRIAYDDAVVVYLNGEAIYEGNVPEGGFDEEGYGAASVWTEPHEDIIIIPGSEFRVGTNVLAVELHQESKKSSDIYLRLGALRSSAHLNDDERDRSVFLGVGSDDSEVLVTWHGRGETGSVEVVEDDGGAAVFAEGCKRIEASAAYANDDGTTTFRATLAGLRPGSAYWYRVADESGAGPSAPQRFELPQQGSFSFIVSGDAQLFDAEDPVPMRTYEQLLAAAARDTKPAFVLSLGDQADDGGEWSLFEEFANAKSFNRIPLAAVVGNHEHGDDTFSRFFFLPNMTDGAAGGTGDMGADYWFSRGSALFLVLNTNDGGTESHAAFMREAVDAFTRDNGNPAWIIAAFHHSLYSVGGHVDSKETASLREELAPYLEELGVNVVLSGHDHSFSRTYPLLEGEIVDYDSDAYSSADGIVYFTAGSSTGTKFYEEEGGEYDYAAMELVEDRPCMTRVDVTDDALSFFTYAMNGAGEASMVDRCVITRAED